MSATARALEVVAEHCDIQARLEAAPAWARVRGIYFNSIESQLERSGLLGRYRSLFADPARTSFRMYPLRDYLVRVAYAGAIRRSPGELYGGMSDLFYDNAVYFGESLLGRGLLRLIASDPNEHLRHAVQSKRMVSNYGAWEIVVNREGFAEIYHRDEWVWIGAALAAAARGGLESCGVSPKLETRLDDDYNGAICFSW